MDRHPFAVPLKTYDEAIGVLRHPLDRAKLDGGVKLDGFRRLDRFVQMVERELQPVADFDAAIAHERAISPSLGGRVMDDRRLQPRSEIETTRTVWGITRIGLRPLG